MVRCVGATSQRLSLKPAIQPIVLPATYFDPGSTPSSVVNADSTGAHAALVVPRIAISYTSLGTFTSVVTPTILIAKANGVNAASTARLICCSVSRYEFTAKSTPARKAATSACIVSKPVEMATVLAPIIGPCGVMIVTPASNPPATVASPARRMECWVASCRCPTPNASSSKFARQCVGPPVTLALMNTSWPRLSQRWRPPCCGPLPAGFADWRSWHAARQYLGWLTLRFG